MTRAVTPVLRSRCSRWPVVQCVAKELDAIQTRMVAILMRARRQEHETMQQFVRRRNQMASRECGRAGRWSAMWFRRVIAWHDHLGRPANAASWPALLLHFRGEELLQRTHAAMGSSSVHAGRTGTRAFPGVVRRRWHDGVAFAKTKL